MRFPGAVQHKVMHCRPGIHKQIKMLLWVPDLRCTANALHRVRDTRHYINAWIPVWARPRMSAWMSCVPS